MSFYGSGLGDRLIDESLFPNEIKDFLKDEEKLFSQINSSFDTLVEVGCMNGRYLEWAMKRKLWYVGIDVIPSYIDEGIIRAKAIDYSAESRFILGGAEELHVLLNWKALGINQAKTLLFFPFNSIGNMHDCVPVIRSLKKSETPFIISTYVTTTDANLCRQKYYDSCKYCGLHMNNDERGVTFISDDGLNTIAYHPEFIIKVFENEGLHVEAIKFSTLGIAYISSKIL